MFPSVFHTLDNGLRLVVRPNHRSPVAAVYVWFDQGSADEGPGEYGAAHLLEHMLFKGTDRFGVGEAAQTIEGVGGDLNAFTTYDHTVYHCTLPAEHWLHGLDVLVDMVRASRIDPDELTREQAVVIEEIRGADDDPDSVIADAAMALAFPQHGYGRPILGTAESVGAIDRAALVDFWRRGYRPERAVITVAGAVDPEEVKAQVEALLGDWQVPGEPRPEREPAPEPAGQRGEHLVRSFATAQVELMWRTPPLGHPDNPALDVLATLLAEGLASPLTRALEGLAQDSWATLGARPRGGVLSAGIVPNTGRTDEATRRALRVLDELPRHVTPGTVDRARRSILADRLFRVETVDGLAHEAAWYTARHGGPEDEDSYYAQIAAVHRTDVLRVARQWLRRDRLQLICLDPDLPEGAVERWLEPPSRPIPARRAPLERRVLANGVTLLVLPEDSPVASVRAVVLGGRLSEQARSAGRAELWSQVVTAGAGDLDDAAMSERLDELAGNLTGVATRSTCGVRASFPAATLVAGLDLVGATLADPWFSEQDVLRLREEHESLLHTQHDHPSQVAADLAWAATWRGHPWRLPELGTASSVANLGPGTLRRLHERLFVGENLVVAVVGGCGPEEVFERLEGWLGELPAEGEPLAPRPEPGPLRRSPARGLAGREQATVVLAARGLRMQDPAAPAASVAAALLGGQGGRLFMELREKRSLAYQTWAQHLDGWDGGLWELGLSTDPSRLPEARSALREALDDLVVAPVSEEELERTRRRLLGQTAIAWQRSSYRASCLALFERCGLPWHLDDQLARIASVDTAQVHTALQRIAAGGFAEIVVEPRT